MELTEAIHPLKAMKQNLLCFYKIEHRLDCSHLRSEQDLLQRGLEQKLNRVKRL